MTDRLIWSFSGRPRLFWIAALCGAVTLAVAFASHRYLASSSATTDYTLARVEPHLLRNQLGLLGKIESAKRLTLSAPFEGVIESVSVSEGQRVEEGEQLVLLSPALLDVQIRQAFADLLKTRQAVQLLQNWAHGEDVARARRAVTNAEMNLNETRGKLADTRRLLEKGIVPRMEVEALEQQQSMQKLDLESSQSELRSALGRGEGENRKIADMELANAQARYDGLAQLKAKSALRAPFAGIILQPQKHDDQVTSTAVQAGQRVSADFSLFDLASIEDLNAVAQVDEGDLHELREGMQVSIFGRGFEGLELQGRVQSISAQASQSASGGGATAYEVVVEIGALTKETQRHVRLGMSAQLSVVTYEIPEGLSIPLEAIQEDASGKYVMYRSSPAASSARRSIQVGRPLPEGVEVFGIGEGYVEVPNTPAL